MRNDVALVLRWFKKSNGHLVGDEKVCINLDAAIKLIRINVEEDPIIAYAYDVKKKLAKKLQPFYIHQIDTNIYDYDVCRYSDYECIEGKIVKVNPLETVP